MPKHMATGQLKHSYKIESKLTDGSGRKGRGFILGLAENEATRMTEGQSDLRQVQAKRLWELGIGRELKFKTFKAYLASIPEPRQALKAHDARFPYLTLIEPRIGLSKLCELGGVAFVGSDRTFVPYRILMLDPKQPYWIKVQDGRKNHNRRRNDCRLAFAEDEYGLTALQGVCIYLQYPQVVGKDHMMVLLNSVPRRDHSGHAYLWSVGDQAVLSWGWAKRAHPQSGTASRLEN